MTISTPPEYHPWTILIRCFSLFCLTGIGDSRFILNRILCFVNLASLYKLVNTTNLLHNFFLSIFINLCMFRATMCPSSGETTVFLPRLVLVILCGLLSGMRCSALQAFFSVQSSGSFLRNSTLDLKMHQLEKNISTLVFTYKQVSQKHSCFSWWWAHSCPKHVEIDKYLFIYQTVQCFHILLRPFNNYIFFFLQLLLSFQSSSINPFSPHQSSNPFRPGKFRSTSFSSSWWTSFHNFFWQSPLFHSLDMSIPLKLFGFKALRTGDADLRFYVTTVQDGWRRFAFLTRWNSVHLQVLRSATPQGGMFPEVSHPQALLGSLLCISWKFEFTKIVSEFVINF